eukprot:2928338-Rhodomonas_salina.1
MSAVLDVVGVVGCAWLVLTLCNRSVAELRYGAIDGHTVRGRLQLRRADLDWPGEHALCSVRGRMGGRGHWGLMAADFCVTVVARLGWRVILLLQRCFRSVLPRSIAVRPPVRKLTSHPCCHWCLRALIFPRHFAAVLHARRASLLVHRFRVRDGQLLGSLIGIGNVDANITLVPIEITAAMRNESGDGVPFCEAVDDCDYKCVFTGRAKVIHSLVLIPLLDDCRHAAFAIFRDL